MDLRKRLQDAVQDVGDRVKDEISEFVAGPDGASSVEGFILGVVRSARGDKDDPDEQSSEKEVRKAARKRRRRLGLASLATGPFAGVTGEVSDLYSETATVCDLADHHRLTLTDAQIGGHMLVLWGIAPDPAAGAAALDGSGPPIAALMATRTNAEYQAAETVPAKIKVIWENRDVMAEFKDAAAGSPFKRVLRAGRDAKDLIARAEEQLGVRLP